MQLVAKVNLILAVDAYVIAETRGYFMALTVVQALESDGGTMCATRAFPILAGWAKR
jgi:hypothetical protein